MKLALGESSVGMERDQLIALRDACGTLWLTEERMPDDTVIEAGQSFVIATPGLTLVMALRKSTVRVWDTDLSAHGYFTSVLLASMLSGRCRIRLAPSSA